MVGNPSTATMGIQPSYEHFGPLRATTGSLGGGKNGALSSNPRACMLPNNLSLDIYRMCVSKYVSCLFVFVLQGLNFLIPILDKIRYVQSLKEIVIDVPEQSAVSLGEWKMKSVYFIHDCAIGPVPNQIFPS